MKILKKIIPLFFIIVLSFWSYNPLFSPGFFPIHDNTQVARVSEMAHSLSDGVFPVRWVPDLGYGYGYPIFNFYAPLSYYAGGVLQLAGLDPLFSTKAMMFLGIIMSGVFMYLLAKEFWGKWAGLVASAFYVYSPFHAIDIYIRGDVAEFWAYAFMPLSLFGLYRVYKSRGDFKWIIVAALGYAGIILSHNLTAMMISPFILGFVFYLAWGNFKKKNIKIVYSLVLSLSLGLSLSAFYFIPALKEQRFTNVLSQIGGGADYKDHFVCALQLWQSQWGFGGSAPGCIDGLSFVIGKIHLAASLLGLILVVVLFYRKTELNKIKILFLCILGFVISVCLMLFVSKPLWDHMPLMAYFQYPWRFLLVTSLFSSLIAAGCVSLFSSIIRFKNIDLIISALFITAVIFMNYKLFIPQYTFVANSSDFTSKEIIKWEASKISDEYMPRDFPKPKDEIDVAKSRFSFNTADAQLISSRESSAMINLKMNILKQTKVHFNIAYFPAWRLNVDGQGRGSIVSKGYDVSLSPGVHTVQMEFVQTSVEKTANMISILGIIGIFIGIIFWNKKLKNE